MRLRPGVALVGMTILPSSVPGASGDSLDDEELEDPDDAGGAQPPSAAGPGPASAPSFEVRRCASAQAQGGFQGVLRRERCARGTAWFRKLLASCRERQQLCASSY